MTAVSATVSPATQAPAEVKKSAGELAIEAAQKPGANVKTLLKAVWSNRGYLRVHVGASAEFGGLGVIKSDLTRMLQALPEADPAPFTLVIEKDGALLVPVAPAE